MSLRVAVLYDGLRIPAKDGVTQRVVELIKRLAGYKGIDTILYVVDRGWVTPDELKSLGVRYRLVPLSYAYGDDTHKLAEMLRADKVDIAHSASSHLAILLYAAYTSRLADVPLIADMHDVYTDLMTSLDDDSEEIAAAELRQKLCAQFADGIITMSARDVPAIKGYGVPDDRLFCIPNGVTMQRPPKGETMWRNAVFVGNMYYEPNKRAAVRIIERIAPKVPDQQFFLVGNAPEDLIHLAQSASNVQYLGAVDDLHEAFDKAAIGLAPLQEGSGMKLKVMTYGAYGLAVIASREAMAGYESTEAILEAESDQAIADAINYLTSDQQTNQRYRHEAFAYIRKHYDWDTLIKKEVEAFNAVHSLGALVASDVASNEEEPKILAVEPIGLPLWMQEGRT